MIPVTSSFLLLLRVFFYCQQIPRTFIWDKSIKNKTPRRNEGFFRLLAIIKKPINSFIFTNIGITGIKNYSLGIKYG